MHQVLSVNACVYAAMPELAFLTKRRSMLCSAVLHMLCCRRSTSQTHGGICLLCMVPANALLCLALLSLLPCCQRMNTPCP
jgi:hypothetical protein